MKSFESAMRDVSTQILSHAPLVHLKESARIALAGGVLALGALTTATPVFAQDGAMRSGGSTQGWGERIGSVMGNVLTVTGRGADRLVSSVSTMVVNGVQTDRLRQGQRDQLDTLALRSVFSYERAESAMGGGVQSKAFKRANLQFLHARKELSTALRVAQTGGADVSAWRPLLVALQAPVGSVSHPVIVEMANPMSARLHRQGGPGYQESQRPVGTIAGLRESVAERRAGQGYQQAMSDGYGQ